MQITHLLAGKVAARLSAVIAGSTFGRSCWRCCRRLAAGNWVNGNPSFSLSVDNLSALTSNSTKSKSLPLSSYIHNTCLTSCSCICFLTGRSDMLGSFVDICIPDLFGDFRRSSRRTAWLCSLIFSRPLTSCNGMFYLMFTDSWAKLVNMLWPNDNIVAAPVNHKWQKCRSACQRLIS